MNIQEIDKWLDNEYGISYTRLEELHDYFFEKYTDQKEEIKRLKWHIIMIKEAIETWNIEYREGKVDFEIPQEITSVVWSDK